MKYPLYFISLLSIFLPAFSYGQHLWEAGAFGGISNYEGGMAPDPVWKESHPAAGVFVKRNMNGFMHHTALARLR